MKRLVVILLALAAVQVNAQDLAHYKKVVKELSSARYQGRGGRGDHPAVHHRHQYLQRQDADVGGREET